MGQRAVKIKIPDILKVLVLLLQVAKGVVDLFH
jgi:hypothetical protein